METFLKTLLLSNLYNFRRKGQQVFQAEEQQESTGYRQGEVQGEDQGEVHGEVQLSDPAHQFHALQGLR